MQPPTLWSWPGVSCSNSEGLFCCDSWDIWSMLVEMAVCYSHRTTCRQFDHITSALADLIQSLLSQAVSEIKWNVSNSRCQQCSVSQVTYLIQLYRMQYKYPFENIVFYCQFSCLSRLLWRLFCFAKMQNVAETDVPALHVASGQLA